MAANYSVQYIFSLVDRFTPGAKTLAAAAGRIKAAVAAAGAALAPLTRRLALAGAAMGAFSAAIVLSGLDAAASFEKEMANVRRVADLSREAMIAYGKDALAISVRTGNTAEDIAMIMTKGAAMGLREKEVLAAMSELTAKVAVAWDDISKERAADALATMTAQWFGDKSPEVAKQRIVELGDAINELSNRAAFKAPEMLKAFERGGIAAKQFGLTAEQYTAYAGTALVTSEKSGELQGTRARMTFDKLMRTVDKPTKAAARALKQLGISRKKLQAAMIKSPQDALLAIMERVNKLPDPIKRNSVVSGLLDARSAAQFRAVAANLNEYKRQLAIVDDKYAAKFAKDEKFMAWLKGSQYADMAPMLEQYGKIMTRTGSVEREFAKRSDTLDFAVKVREAAFRRLQILASTPLLQPLAKLNMGIARAFEGISAWVEANEKLASDLLTGGALAGVAALAYGLLEVATWATGAASKMALLASMGKILIWIGIASATHAAVQYVYDNWSRIKELVAEPLRFNVIFPEAPEWLKWIWTGAFKESERATLQSQYPDPNSLRGMTSEYLQGYTNRLAGFSAAGRSALDAGAIPRSVGERISVESSVRTSIDPVQVNLSTNAIELRYTGPIGGPSQIGVSAPNTRGQSTVEAGSVPLGAP